MQRGRETLRDKERHNHTHTDTHTQGNILTGKETKIKKGERRC